MRYFFTLFAFSALFVALPFSTSKAQILPDDGALVGFWQFNEPSGKLIEDLSFNGNQGTFENGATRHIEFRKNISDLVAYFDGVDDRIAIDLISSSIQNLSEVTIQAWIYPTQYAGIIMRAGNSNLDRYSFGINEQGGLYFRSGFKEQIGAWYTEPATVPLNTWSKVTVSAALVNSDSVSFRNPKFYVDDIEIPATNTLAPRGSLVGDSPYIYLGNNQDLINRAESGFDSAYEGSMDDIRIYNKALLPVESDDPGSSEPPTPTEVTVPDTPLPISPIAQTPEPTPSMPCPALSRNLELGSSGEDVRSLQAYLTSTGDYAYKATTGYFGFLTQAAVQRFQAEQGIVSAGSPDTTGYGLVGPKTRAKIAKACGGNSSAAARPDTPALQASLMQQIQELLSVVESLQAKIAALRQR